MHDTETIGKILSCLASGNPLGELDKFGLILRGRDDSVGLDELVKTARSAHTRGPAHNRDVFWLLAPYGGGKTEALSRIRRLLLSRHESEGKYKVATVSLDLKSASEVTSGSGLQAQIFRQATRTNPSSGTPGELNFLINTLIQDGELSQFRQDMIGLGLDVAIGLLPIPVPGGSLLGSKALAHAWRKFKLRDSVIQKALESKGITSDDATRLFSVWIRYCLRPNSDNWNRFSSAYEGLASEEQLFHIFCQFLENAGYSTLVILVDEATLLVGAEALTKSFETIYDRKLDALAARGKTPRFRPREASAWPAARRLNLAPSPGIS